MTMQKIFDMSPTIQKMKADAAREAAREAAMENSRSIIIRLLTKRFGPISEDLVTHLKAINNAHQLNSLIDVAIDCTNLDEFRADIPTIN